MTVDPSLPLVLASQSPRRADLLREADVAFEVGPNLRVDESCDPTMAPAQVVESLARRKAQAVANEMPGRLVLGADTIVVHEGTVLGKPANEHDALAMLTRLSDRWHDVWTGIAIISPTGEVDSAHLRTALRFRALDEASIRAYIATGEPMDKAGAYAIQGGAGPWVVERDGTIDNVIGLPVALVKHHLSMVTS